MSNLKVSRGLGRKFAKEGGKRGSETLIDHDSPTRQ
jgi:hypothetical protein